MSFFSHEALNSLRIISCLKEIKYVDQIDIRNEYLTLEALQDGQEQERMKSFSHRTPLYAW